MKLVLTPKFERAYRKYVKQDKQLQYHLEDVLREMEIDISAGNLGTHKLSGKLKGLQSCSCGYDCRIVFSIERDPESKSDVIILLDIGTHDEVY